MKLRILVLASLTLIVLGLVVTPALAADIKVGLTPGQTATIPMSYWCLDYGKPFPTAIGNPGARAADPVVAILLAAITDGSVVTDPYQTNVAIWHQTTGEYKDYASRGTTGAEKIVAEAANVTVPPIPAGVLTLGDAVTQGLVSVEIKNLTTVADPTLPGHPFHGTADVIVTNISKDNVEFTFFEGTTFPPAGGEDAQNLIAHLNPQRQPELPQTGGAWADEMNGMLVVFAAGLTLLLGGVLLVARSTRKPL